MQKEMFSDFLKKIIPENSDSVTEIFEQYYNLLTEENKKINLVSRKTLPEDYWVIHFLDSLLPLKFMDFDDKKILDFGTGGGLPGLPIKFVSSNSQMYFLDSITKKINSIKNFVKSLDVKQCYFINSRIEDVDLKKYRGFFDLIVCRSVRIEKRFVKSMLNVLNENGKIILYKSQKLEDADLFNNKKIHSVDYPLLGKRNIVEISKNYG